MKDMKSMKFYVTSVEFQGKTGNCSFP